MNLFRRRSVADLQAEVLRDKSLKRVLGPVNLTALELAPSSARAFSPSLATLPRNVPDRPL